MKAPVKHSKYIYISQLLVLFLHFSPYFPEDTGCWRAGGDAWRGRQPCSCE